MTGSPLLYYDDCKDSTQGFEKEFVACRHLQRIDLADFLSRARILRGLFRYAFKTVADFPFKENPPIVGLYCIL